MKNLALFLLMFAAAPASGDDLAPHRPLPPRGGNDLLSVVSTAHPVGDGVYQLLFTHRFTQELEGSQYSDLWGFDSSADIGIGVDWGLTPNLEVGFYRNSFLDDLSIHGKFRWIAQCEAFPISIATRAGFARLDDPTVEADHSRAFGQLILQRDSGRLTLIAAPSWSSESISFDDVVNIPVGLMLKMTDTLSLLAEVTPKNPDNPAGSTAWRLGVEKRLGGHSFAFVLGNSRATTLHMDLASDLPGGYKSDDVRVGFNIIRRWSR